jgi:hypothetical protein
MLDLAAHQSLRRSQCYSERPYHRRQDRCGWTTVAVGCHLGYLGHLANLPNAPARRRPLATIGDAGGQGEIAVAQRPEGIRAGTGSALSGRVHLLRPGRDPVRRLQPGRTATLAPPARPCTLIRSPGAKIAGWPGIDRGVLTAIC